MLYDFQSTENLTSDPGDRAVDVDEFSPTLSSSSADVEYPTLTSVQLKMPTSKGESLAPARLQYLREEIISLPLPSVTKEQAIKDFKRERWKTRIYDDQSLYSALFTQY